MIPSALWEALISEILDMKLSKDWKPNFSNGIDSPTSSLYSSVNNEMHHNLMNCFSNGHNEFH